MGAEGRQCDQTQGEDRHLQAKEGDLKQSFPSQPQEGSNPADTLIVDVWPPEL